MALHDLHRVAPGEPLDVVTVDLEIEQRAIEIDLDPVLTLDGEAAQDGALLFALERERVVLLRAGAQRDQHDGPDGQVKNASAVHVVSPSG